MKAGTQHPSTQDRRTQNRHDLELSDPRVPGVASIADGAVLAELLAAAGEELLERGYLRYKPGTSLVAGLRLASGPAFAYAVSAAARPKLTKLLERAPRGAVLVSSAAEPLLIARPAADRDLPALADPSRLVSAVGRRVETWTTLTYKPQRRWVGCPDDDPQRPGPVLRAYRPRELPAISAAWRLAERIGATGIDARLPTMRKVSARRGLTAVGWLPGTPLDHLSTETGAQLPTSVLAEVGMALAQAHSSLARPSGGAAVDVTQPRMALRELAEVLPELRRRAESLLRGIEARAPRHCGAHPIHGDFSADQVIVGTDGRIGFADWDRARWGDPGADLGSLQAAGMPETAYAAVLEGYAGVRAVPESAEWHRVAASVQRLTEPLRRGSTHWRAEIADRLATLEIRLGQGA